MIFRRIHFSVASGELLHLAMVHSSALIVLRIFLLTLRWLLLDMEVFLGWSPRGRVPRFDPGPIHLVNLSG